MNGVSDSELRDVGLSDRVVTGVEVDQALDAQSSRPISNRAVAEPLKFALDSSLCGRMLVWGERTVLADGEGRVKEYASLAEALAAESSFAGDVILNEDWTYRENWYIELNARKLLFDLNGKTLKITSRYFARLRNGAELQIRNGRLEIDAGTGAATFNVSGGILSLDDVDVAVDCSGSASSSTRVFNLCPAVMPSIETCRPVLKIGKNARIRLAGTTNGEALIVTLSLFFVLVKSSSTPSDMKLTEAQYTAQYGEKDYRPQVDFDGIFENIGAADSGGEFNASNGSDKVHAIINIGPSAQIRGYNHGIYMGSAGVVTLNGGYISAKNAITMRSGRLIVPKGAEPTVVGFGDFKEYDPIHSVRQGSDAGTNLMLGHAVLLENNGTTYGGEAVTADIQSGTFVSLNNTPIAYYCVGVRNQSDSYAESEEPGQSATYTYIDASGQEKTAQFHFKKRSDKLGFVKYCRLSRYASEDDSPERYDFATGRYPAAGVVNPESSVNGFGYVVRDEPYLA